MSSKVVEANAKVHSLAMAVAVSRVLKSSLAIGYTVRMRRVLVVLRVFSLK